MTKKSVRRSNRSTPRKRGAANLDQRLAIALLVGLLIILVYYLATGSDPLGLFTQEDAATEGEPVIAAGTAEDWWRVYFTAPRSTGGSNNLSGTVIDPLLDYINNAERSIHVATFEFDLRPVAEALIQAHRRGVEVRWVTDDEYGIQADGEEGEGLFALLQGAGIEVHDDARTGLMHNKFWVFDRQIVWTGSTNVTANDVLYNNNNVLVMEVPEVAAVYEQEFAEMWRGEFGAGSTSAANRQTVMVEDSRIRVLFAPEDRVDDELVPLIAGAQERIRFMAFSFTDENLGSAMRERAGAGIDVKGIFETRGSETEYSQMRPLFCAEIPVRQDGNPRTFHHKVLIIDDETVVTGSFNFTASAADSNEENLVIVHNREIAAQYLGEFERRWQEAAPPDRSDMGCR